MSKPTAKEQARAQAYAAKQAAFAAKKDRRKQDNKIALIASVIVLALAFASQLVYSNFGPGHSTAASASPSASPAAQVPSKALAQGRTWKGTIQFNTGALSIALDGKKAPQAVSNFISLAKEGFFNTVACHRLTNSGIYVLQCGDPTGTSNGGPGYTFGPIENEPSDNVYGRGVLAMARAGNNASSMGSQFFIVYRQSTIPADQAGGYTVFGSITSGLDNLKPTINGGIQPGGRSANDGKPKVPAIINSINLK